MSTYSVKQGRKGKSVVEYACTRCGAALQSPLIDDGSIFPCPTCGTQIKKTGEPELQKAREIAKRQEEARQQQVENEAAKRRRADDLAAAAAPAQKERAKPVEYAVIRKAPTPMSGGKLFLIISGAVACGITIAIVVYIVFFTALFTAHSKASANATLTVASQRISAESDAVIQAVELNDVDKLKTLLLGTVNWQEVATPALVAALRMDRTSTDYPQYESPAEKQQRDFWQAMNNRLLQDGANVNEAIAEITNVIGYRFLLSHGANINSVDPFGQTALMRCTDTESKYADLYINSVSFLLDHGANPNVTDKDGNTPLHLAAKANAAGEIDALIAHGANINTKNNAGQTPLAIANITVATEASQIIKQHGGIE